MSDRQDQLNELRYLNNIDNLRANGYNLDQATLNRLGSNMPAAWQDMDKVAPGTELTNQQLNDFWTRWKQSKFQDGSENMSFQDYLKDPRSALKVENGKVIWRPEQMQGDFYGLNNESMFDTIMGSPIGSVLLPAAGGALANYMGLMNGTPGGLLGDTASNTGGLGETVGSFGMNFDMPAGVNNLESGFNFADTYNPVSTLEGGAVSPINTNLSAGGFNGLDQLIGQATTGGEATLGSVGAGGAIGAGLGTAPITGVGGGSWWDSLMNAMGGSSNVGNIMKGGMSLLEYLQSKDNASNLQSSIDKASQMGDPFGSQRPFYQNMLLRSYTDPNFWKDNATFKGLNDVAVNDASRIAAARGFNNSSNLLYDVADRVQKTGMNFANTFQGQLGQLAGGGISPGTSAQIAANGANQVQQANQQTNGALGATLTQLPNLINGIKGVLA